MPTVRAKAFVDDLTGLYSLDGLLHRAAFQFGVVLNLVKGEYRVVPNQLCLKLTSGVAWTRPHPSHLSDQNVSNLAFFHLFHSEQSLFSRFEERLLTMRVVTDFILGISTR